MSQSTSPLVVRSLRKVYHPKGKPEFVAVDGVSFEVSPGECFGLLGPNGAGKSTSMKCITGFYRPTSGSVEISGLNVHEFPKQARLELGVCSQDDNLDTDFDVLDQMIQFASYFGLSRKEGKARAENLIRRFGLSDKSNEPVEALSGGMRRRLQVARGLINHPKLLVLDEPTTGLDPEARRILWDILTEERRNGLAILLSTHYMEEAERLCDRVAIIHRGRILDCAPTQDLISKHMGTATIREETRPSYWVERAPNLEDVYLKLTGGRLEEDTRENEEAK